MQSDSQIESDQPASLQPLVRASVMTTTEMQKIVADAGYSMRRQEYLLGFTTTVYGTNRCVSGHRWEIHERASGKKLCEGTNPKQCFRRFKEAQRTKETQRP